MTKYSAMYGLRLPTDPDVPDLPQAMENFTNDLEPILDKVNVASASAVTMSEGAKESAETAQIIAEAALDGDPSGVSDYVISFSDGAGNEAGGFTERAVLDLVKPLTVNGVKAVTEPVQSSEWAFAITDTAGNVAFGVRQDGSVYPAGGSVAGAADVSKLASDIAGLTRSKTTAVTAIGDSLTYGFFDGRAQGRDGWPDTLKTLTSATVTNAAMSGYTVDESGIRASFIQPLVTVSGGSIPSSGDVVVTVKDANNYDWQNRTVTSQQNFVGTLAGVPGRLKRDTNGNFVFTRATQGQAVKVPAGTPFIGEFAGHWDETLVIFLGRNNVARNAYGDKSGDTPTHVVEGIKNILAGSTVGVKQSLIISVTTGSWEVRGSAGYEMVKAINEKLKAEFPTRFYDLRSYLVNQAIYDLGITPTSDDVKAIEGDTLPPSIMAYGSDGATRDGVHYSRETAKLVGARIFEELNKRGWINGK